MKIKLKKFKSILIIFMFTAIIYSFIFGDVINGSTALVTLENWDSYIQGTKNGAGTYFTWVTEDDTNTNYIINVYAISSPYSYRFNSNTGNYHIQYVWWNFTENFDFIYGFNLCFDASYQQNGNTVSNYIYFKNNTDIIFKFDWVLPATSSTGYLRWTDVYGSAHNLYSFTSSFTQRTFWINVTYYKENLFNVTNWVEGSGTYYFNGTGYMGLKGGVVYDGNITKVKFYLKSESAYNSVMTYYLDDFKLNFNPNIVYEPCGDTSGLNYKGKIDTLTPQFYSENDPYMEIQRDVPFKNVNIQVIDLLVNKDWFERLTDWNAFTLHVNSFYYAYPSCYIEYRGQYLLRWLVDVDLIDAELLLEFQSLIKGNDPLNPNTYWMVGISPLDVDNDGDAIFYYHTVLEGPNWGWLDGLRQWVQGDPHSYPYTVTNFYSGDLMYRVYYSGDDEIFNQEYDDTLTLEEKTFNNYPCTEVMYATISTLADPSFIRVENEGIYLLNYSITGQSDSTWFTCVNTGLYNVTLWRGGSNIKTDSFTVSGIEKNDYIYTMPLISKPTYEFIVYFKYNHTTPCSIKLYNMDGNIIENWFYNDTPIISNFTFSIDNEGIYKFKLYTYIYNSNSGESQYSFINEGKHIVKDNYPNVLNIYKETISAPNLECQLFSGSHNFLGESVYIRINNEVFLYAGNHSEFTIAYCPQYNGEYKSDLILKTSNGIVILDNKTFYVTGGKEEESQNVGNIFNFKDMPVFFKIIASLLIIITLTITPLILSFALSKGKIEINIPSLVYIAFFFIGIVASIMLGLLEVWVLFVVLFGLILTFAIFWIYGKSSEAGG